MELPLTHPEYYEEMGIMPPKGVGLSASIVKMIRYPKSRFTVTHVFRGKEMSLSRDLSHYYKLPKSDSNAVYLLSNSVYYLSTLSGNSLFPGKSYKVILACQQ